MSRREEGRQQLDHYAREWEAIQRLKEDWERAQAELYRRFGDEFKKPKRS